MPGLDRIDLSEIWEVCTVNNMEGLWNVMQSSIISDDNVSSQRHFHCLNLCSVPDRKSSDDLRKVLAREPLVFFVESPLGKHSQLRLTMEHLGVLMQLAHEKADLKTCSTFSKFTTFS